MLNWLGKASTVALLTAAVLSGCQSQTTAGAEPSPTPRSEALELPGVETSKLTNREKDQWSSYVGELLAPCPDQPVSIAQCVTELRPCETCKPAAEFLVKQVTRGRTRAQAEDAFRKRFSPDEVKDIDVTGSPAKGPADAPVTIVEWADFECPFCAMASPVLDQTVQRHAGKVRLVFKQYPLSSHEHSETAARAAVAASLQGKFWEMHHALFANQQHLDEASIEKLARDLQLDLKQFNADRKGEVAADTVSRDKKQAEQLGLRGTPMIYINGRSFDLETFDLQEDLDDWILLEARLRTGSNDKASPPPSTAASAPTTQPASGHSAAGSDATADGKSTAAEPAATGNRPPSGQ